MSWIKENKFLAGFTGATVVAAGALSFLLFQAKGAYDTATTTYDEQSSELSRLQGAQPFPSPENVKKIEEQRKQYIEAVGELQQKLAKLELPVEEIAPPQFQDRLRQTVDSLTRRASEARVELPQDFSLGFQRYLAEPPPDDAAPQLGRQLKAIEAIIATLIDSKVAKIVELKRDELPNEKAGTREADNAKGAKGGKPTKDLLEKQPIEIKFVSDQSGIMQVLNKIVASNTQFYIPRLVTVKNEQDNGPARADSSFTAPPPPSPGPTDPAGQPSPTPPPTDPSATPGVATTQAGTGTGGQTGSPYIVGEEKAEVTMRIEIIDFADKATTAK